MIATTEEPEEGGKPNPFSMHMHQLSNNKNQTKNTWEMR